MDDSADKKGLLAHIAAPLRPLAVRVDSLHLDPSNARQHGEKNSNAIKASLSRFGQRKPIVVQASGMIVRAGNGTLEAARALGWSHIAATIIDEGHTQATAFAIADNQTALSATWDDDILSATLESLVADGVDLHDLGFDDDDLSSLIQGIDAGGDTDPDNIPEVPEEARSKAGDVWQLGDHRIMCGDSTSSADVEVLMDGELASVIFTSPPYDQQRDYGGECSSRSWGDLMRGVFGVLRVTDDSQLLVNLGLIHRQGELVEYWREWWDWMPSQGWTKASWYVWDAGAPIPGEPTGRLGLCHEFVFHLSKNPVVTKKTIKNKTAGAQRVVYVRKKDGRMSKPRSVTVCPARPAGSVARVDRRANKRLGHPAPYPVDLPSHFLNSWPKGHVYEPFSGSGTTIIACEQLGRRCYAMEIHPPYVDMSVERWERFTGHEAVLVREAD